MLFVVILFSKVQLTFLYGNYMKPFIDIIYKCNLIDSDQMSRPNG